MSAAARPTRSAPSLRLVDVDDATLLARLAGGDSSALGALYDRHARALHGFLARVATVDEAEDLVQATFVRATERARGFDPARGAPRAWLFGVAAKLAQERRRALMRRARAFVRAAASPNAAAPSEGDRRDVARALATLSEAKRVVIVLAEVEGFSCQEIADMLEIPLGTVWTRLHHARTELRARLEERRP